MSSRKPRIQLVFDFDGTMTTADTTAVIGSHCIAKARELAPPDTSEHQLPKPMEYYSELYMQEYQAWEELNSGSEAPRTTIDEEVSHLSQSRNIDYASFMRVRDAVLNTPGGIGELSRNERLRNDFMIDAGRQAVRSGEVQIRDPEALRRLMAKAEEEGNVWGIVSVSFSRRFIIGALIEAGLVREERAQGIAGWIRCNELLAPDPYDDKSNVLCSTQDKKDAFRELLADWRKQSGARERAYPISSRDDDSVITIYVGDSTTDLGCLVGLSIGMYLSEGKREDAVAKTLNRFNIGCVPIEMLPTKDAPSKLIDILAKLQDEKKPAHVVCAIHEFQQLYEWVSAIG
ncbi:hypothetical protein LTR37_019665 [Vermiconidia calcicola]|uniref:Uncharacterized protein n=1 Tax=Vermiconidia calcicola TaxID=1690605 RepID=A0ACC3MDP2_9PEZI|nr:hypothetical protein LTR37_019665 [Vermiconidia calcicola]